MPKSVFAATVLLVGVSLALANVPAGSWHQVNPWIDWQGGPDAYGYTAIDSDQPGGPAYQWKDITTIGTQVTTLGDDNYAGPFNIGFNFNYYWYTRNQIFIGSNGYLKFPPAYNIASPFPASCPLTANPNDYLGIYTADLDFTTGGQCYYWTNNVDSFVVSFINLPSWSTGGSHTFQAILSGNNNKIRYQYGAQVGTFQTLDDIICIENVSGQVGLERLHDQYIPHDNYAIVFTRPDTTTYAVHDMGISNVINSSSQAIFLTQGSNYNPVVYVKNYGNQPEAGQNVVCQIRTMAGATVYNQTYALPATTAGQEIMITYPTAWAAAPAGAYTISATVNMTGDMNTANNTKSGELQVVVLPGELLYDDGAVNTSGSWQGATGGYGMKFTPPSFPMTVVQVKVYINSVTTPPQTFTAQLVDDDGAAGTPGTILFTQTISATAAGWYTAPCNVTVSSGSVYAAWQQSNQSTTTVGIDNTGPISRQTWEYTTSWAPYRSLETEDAMIRIVTGAPLNLNLTMSPVSPPVQIPAIGGSFDYNISCQNLAAGAASFQVWNMVTLPTGTNYGPVLGPANLTLQASQTISRVRIQSVPGAAPAGTYTYRSYVGIYPSSIADSAYFNFTKLPTDGGGKMVTRWYSGGEAFPGEIMAEAPVIPAEFALQSVYPNPFNPTANIVFTLGQSAAVKLAVYDVLGNEAAVLVDSWVSAGEQLVVFDGSRLASGVYFVKLAAGDNVSVKKVMLLK